jgi:hypothetical protein
MLAAGQRFVGAFGLGDSLVGIVEHNRVEFRIGRVRAPDDRGHDLDGRKILGVQSLAHVQGGEFPEVVGHGRVFQSMIRLSLATIAGLKAAIKRDDR